MGFTLRTPRLLLISPQTLSHNKKTDDQNDNVNKDKTSSRAKSHVPKSLSSTSFGARIRKSPAIHLNEGPLINTNRFAAQALNLIVNRSKIVYPHNSFLVTTQDFSFSHLVIFPKLSFAGCTFYD